MIPQIIFKKLALPWIEKIFFKMFDQQALIWKFRENNDYRELPNEADRRLDVLEEKFGMMMRDLHPSKDFPITKKEANELLKFMKQIKTKNCPNRVNIKELWPGAMGDRSEMACSPQGQNMSQNGFN